LERVVRDSKRRAVGRKLGAGRLLVTLKRAKRSEDKTWNGSFVRDPKRPGGPKIKLRAGRLFVCGVNTYTEHLEKGGITSKRMFSLLDDQMRNSSMQELEGPDVARHLPRQLRYTRPSYSLYICGHRDETCAVRSRRKEFNTSKSKCASKGS
jgi:hypothetical protein